MNLPIRNANLEEATVVASYLKRVLWIGSNCLSGKRERQILEDHGLTVVFAGAGGPADVAGDGLERSTYANLAAEIGRPNRRFGERLHADFPAIVVEGNATLFMDYIRAYSGRIIFRSYGMNTALGDLLWESDVRSLLHTRPNVFYAPSSPLDPDTYLPPGSTVELPSLQVTTEDLLETRWLGPFSSPRPALVVTAAAGDDAANERLRRFVEHTFCDARTYAITHLPFDAEQGLGHSVLPPAQLPSLANASALLYADQSTTLIHRYAYQALLIDMPIIYLSGSRLAAVMEGDAGEASTIADAHRKIGRLVNGDADLIQQVLQEQRGTAARLRAAQRPDAFGAKFAEMVLTPRDEPEDPFQFSAPAKPSNWQHLERLLASLAEPPDETDASSHEPWARAKPVVDCLFQVALQRDPSAEELASYMLQVLVGPGAPAVFRSLLWSKEGRELWPKNRMRAWLEQSEAD